MKKILPYIIPFLPVLFLLIIFLEISIPWADNTYDLGRLLQCALIWLSSGICFALPNSGGQKLSRNQMIILISLFSLIILDIFQAKFPIFAVLDAAFLVSLFAYFPILKNSMPKIAPKILDYLALTIGLLPIWIIIWLLLSYAERLSGGIAGDHWHMGFRNIRQYDDTLLPCLILLWHVAQKYSKKFQMVVCLVASLYLTSLFIDGARAVILSLIVGGVFTFIIKFKLKKQWLILPIASAVGGWVIWQILQFADNAPTIELTRTTTSGRATMWLNSLNLWWNNFWTGIGGAHYAFQSAQFNPLELGHIHNFVLQLVLEWGVVGLIILIFLALGCLKYIVRNHANIPPILLSGSVAVILNALLGGSYIYPSSEMAIIFLLAYTANNTQIIEYKNNSKIYAVIGLIAICVVIGIIRHDFFHYGVGKIDPNSCKGPRFWLDASRIELSDGLKTDIPIPCQDNIGN